MNFNERVVLYIIGCIHENIRVQDKGVHTLGVQKLIKICGGSCPMNYEMGHENTSLRKVPMEGLKVGS